MRDQGWRIVAVELGEDVVPLTRVGPTLHSTIVLLGHELAGVPDTWVEAADECVTIPMVGVGASLNVAVSGSLVLYRLAGLA
jgi:tRNA (guanosine-2'-O-)-methyltransferase